MKSDNWISQYNRVVRWKVYILQLSITEDVLEPQRIHDYFFSFVNNCNHLGDWLKKCGYISAIDYRDTNQYLDICRALSNGDKHFKIDKNLNSYNHEAYRTHVMRNKFITSTSSTGFYDNYDQDNNRIPIKPSYPLIDGNIIIQVGTETYEALDFIDQCISARHDYFENEGIDILINGV
jgi:hypothetical protein